MDTRRFVVSFVLVISISALVVSYDIVPVNKYSGDINSDGIVDGVDLSIFFGQWLQSPGDPNADIAPAGGDGMVNFQDFSVLSKNWLGNSALSAAKIGFNSAHYVIGGTSYGVYNNDTLYETNSNTLSVSDCNEMWNRLCHGLQTEQLGGLTVPPAEVFTDAIGSGVQIMTQDIPCGTTAAFRIRFYRYDSQTNLIRMDCTGTYGLLHQTVSCCFSVSKDRTAVQYAVVSRGRIWITGDTTIRGSVYSTWNLSTPQLTQLRALKGQITQKLAAGTLNSTSFAPLVSTLLLSSPNRTMILDELLSSSLITEHAAAKCISCMSASSLTVAPITMTRESAVLGSINTCWSEYQVETRTWQFETLDSSGSPIYQTDSQGNILFVTDSSGNFLLDDKGRKIKARVVTSNGDNVIDPGEDEIQGICADINYGQTPSEMTGLSISDYDTSMYKSAIPTTTQSGTASYIADGKLGTSGVSTVIEYYPHAQGSYTTPSSGGSYRLTRYKYENKTIHNVVVGYNTNALFKNCTFEEVLYIDCSVTGSTNCNNVRFENCTFNGTIITNVPATLISNWWIKNCLYFTGTATFQNNSSIPEATILAPNFNVNLGNTNPTQSDSNVLTGAIVGGIVDIRGNAQIYGTVISMADTSTYPSGYVTNIGATDQDGGSETIEPGDIGTIEITPDPGKMLPSGIMTPVILVPVEE
jgi:hypothetical protein